MDYQQPSNNKIFYQRPERGYGYIYRYIAPSGKSYIGQTINTLAERAKNIISGIGYKKCSLFWKAIQKYKFTSFKVEILDCVPIEKLNELEKYYIKLFNTLAPNGYNLSTGGGSGKTCEVYVYCAQNGKFLEHYNSISEASLYTGVPVTKISSIMSDKTNLHIAHNLTFSKKYIENFEIVKRSNYRPVYVYNSDGSYKTQFSTIEQTSRELKISTSAIRRHLESGTILCNLYFRNEQFDKILPIDKPLKRGKIIRQIDPVTFNTTSIYPSLAAAARAVGLSSSSSIARAIKRNGKAKGFYWQIIEGSTTKYSGNPTESVRDDCKVEDIV